MKWLHRGLLVIGMMAFVFLVLRVGPDVLWRDAAHLGWGIVPILMLAGLEHLGHALAWLVCFSPGARPAWSAVFGAHLAGNAISLVTPTATLGGELARGGLLRKRVASGEIVATVAIDRLAYALADIIPSLPGVWFLLQSTSVPAAARIPLAVGALLVVLGTLIFFAIQRSGRLVRRLSERAWVKRLPGELGGRLAELGLDADGHLERFHAERAPALAGSVALHALANLAGGAQWVCLLAFMGEPIEWQPVLQVFVVVTALDLASFFVPGRLGAQEGARMLATSMAGYGPELGLLFALVQRVEQLVWTAAGLGLYPALAARAERGGEGG